MFFIVLTKTWNKPKQAETSQNEPKPAETTQNQTKRPKKKIVERPEITQNFKIEEICNFLLAFDFQTSSSNAQIWIFWAKK